MIESCRLAAATSTVKRYPVQLDHQVLLRARFAAYARGLPVAQATPTGHAAATTHLSGQQVPGNACFKHNDDPAQSRTINNPRPPT
jgi:hypothetical protein